MEVEKIDYQEQVYFLNPNEYFLFNHELVKEKFDEIKFPVVIMDTEFFNQSHEDHQLKYKDRPKPPLYTKQNPSLIYTTSFSIAKNYEELLKRDNDKSIFTYSIRRRFKDENFDFNQEMNRILTKFFNFIIKQKVSTLVFAGKANDERILNNWINQNKSLFNKKKANFIIHNKGEKDKLRLNIVDVYPILEQGLSYHDNPEVEPTAKLKKGTMGEGTVQIPGLKHFYDRINLFPGITKNREKEKTDIYSLCVDVLKLYTIKTLSPKEFRKYQTSYRQAVKHCHNDVLELTYLIYFLYVFANKSPDNNPFIRKTNE